MSNWKQKGNYKSLDELVEVNVGIPLSDFLNPK